MYNRVLSYLVLSTGLGISAIAAYYSIVGLTAIFASAFWPVVIMGSALEVGKLVAISWLHKNWKIAPLLIKAYLFVAITILMLITSMGIFGFLSRAHIEQSLSMNTGVIEQIQILDNQVRFTENTIQDIDTQISQIDSAIAKLTDRGQAQTSLRAADQQRKTRDTLITKKQEEIRKIAEIKAQRIKLESEFKKIEAEVGPLKYVAEIIYGGSDKEVVDKAIRLVIILLIIVFDPLAILLLLAFNISVSRDDNPEFLDLSEVNDGRKDS